jgi:hypothetical protein
MKDSSNATQLQPGVFACLPEFVAAWFRSGSLGRAEASSYRMHSGKRCALAAIAVARLSRRKQSAATELRICATRRCFLAVRQRIADSVTHYALKRIPVHRHAPGARRVHRKAVESSSRVDVARRLSARRRVADLTKLAVNLAFELLGNFVQDVADLVQPATLLHNAGILGREGRPEAVGAVSDRESRRAQASRFEIVQDFPPTRFAFARGFIERDKVFFPLRIRTHNDEDHTALVSRTGA